MKKILVLDDEADVEFIFNVMLEDDILEGKLHIDFFSNPQDCLDHFSKNPNLIYDHIFSDINMPQISGIQFVTELRKKGYHGQISFISAYLEEDYESDRKVLNVPLFFSKPLSFDAIRKILQL